MSRQVCLLASVLISALTVAACGNTTDGTAMPSPIRDGNGNATSPPRPGPTPPAPQPPLTPVICDAGRAQFALGQRASDELLERARLAAGAATARFIRPDEAVTLEFLGSRLNLGLDARDVVRAVSCG